MSGATTTCSAFKCYGRPLCSNIQSLLILFVLLTLTLKSDVLGNEEVLTTLGNTSDAVGLSPFRIIIDGGSTGSRLHLFEFVKNDSPSGIDCVRRGSWKAYTPLSSFARLPSETLMGKRLESSQVSDHLLPLFEEASDIIPPEYHSTTSVRYQATAGMRLLEESERQVVYDALYDGLMNSTFNTSGVLFPFRGFKKKHVATLSGEKEAFFGAVAANFLSGAVDVFLKLKYENSFGNENDTAAEMKVVNPLGALDMGGASAQIGYLPSSGSCKANYQINISSEERIVCDNNSSSTIPDQLEMNTFFSISHLNFGVDPIREKLWDIWIDDYRNFTTRTDIHNPCAFKGHITEWKGYNLIGTGNATECSLHVRRIISSSDEYSSLERNDAWENKSRRVNGVDHPPISGKFMAMSNFFFSLDSLRVLSHAKTQAHHVLNEAWPNPTVQELENALDGFCSRSWQGDLEEIQHNAHKYTRADILPHRCLESVYIVNLLRHGFGFDPSTRDITYIYDIAGSEIEWTLGMALWLFAQENNTGEESLFPSTVRTTSSNDFAGSCPFDDRSHRTTSQPYQ